MTPIDALIIVQTPAATTIRLATSSRRSSAGRKPGIRRKANVPATASKVLPNAMPSAATNGAPVQRFTAKAPRKTAGQSRYPKRSRAASAMPVGAQTSVAKPAMASSIRPVRAAPA